MVMFFGEWKVNDDVRIEDATVEVFKEFSNSFFEFRFGLMSTTDFVALLPSYGGLFSGEDYQEILQIIASPMFQPQMFSRSRQARTGTNPFDKLTSVLCTRSIAKYCSIAPYYINTIETSSFSTNKVLFLKSSQISLLIILRIADTSSMKWIFQPKLQLLDVLVQEVLYSGNSWKYSTKPILIKPGYNHEIQTKIYATEKICSGGLRNREVHIDPDIVVQFHNDPIVDDDPAARGIITGLQFLKALCRPKSKTNCH